METEKEIYIIEFKINQSADLAIAQIKEKGYAEKYSDDPRPKKLLGINFDPETRRVDDYVLSVSEWSKCLSGKLMVIPSIFAYFTF